MYAGTITIQTIDSAGYAPAGESHRARIRRAVPGWLLLALWNLGSRRLYRRLVRTGRSASCSCGWSARGVSYDALDAATDAHVFGDLAAVVRRKLAHGR